MVAPDDQRTGVGARRLFAIVDALIREAARGPCLQAVRRRLHGRVEIARGRARIVDGEIAERARDQRLRLLRIERDRGREIVDRELMLALALIEEATVVIGLRVVGPDRDRLVEVVERVDQLSALAKDGFKRVGGQAGKQNQTF